VRTQGNYSEIVRILSASEGWPHSNPSAALRALRASAVKSERSSPSPPTGYPVSRTLLGFHDFHKLPVPPGIIWNGVTRRTLAKVAQSIPAPAVKRLSLYLRQLESILRTDQKTISSKQLGASLKLTDAQVRKDLAYFGQFGSPGVGYEVEDLVRRLRRILGTDRVWNVLLVGLGNLGSALTAYRGFEKKGFRLVAVFDADPAKIGRPVPRMPDVAVRGLDDLQETVRRFDIQLAIVAVPAEAGQWVADRLQAAGIRGILNFAPVTLTTTPDVAISSVDLAVQLEQLSFRVGCSASNGENGGNHRLPVSHARPGQNAKR